MPKDGIGESAEKIRISELLRGKTFTFVPKNGIGESAKKIRISELLRGKTFYHNDRKFRIPFGNCMDKNKDLLSASYVLKMLEKCMIILL